MEHDAKKRKRQYVLSFGIPLLDVIVNVGEDYLSTNNIEPNSCIQYEECYSDVFKDIDRLNPIYQPGGTVTNTARIMQWILPESRLSLHIGAVGNDKERKLLIDSLSHEKVDFIYQEKHGKTGRKLFLISENSKTIITDEGVSKVEADFLNSKKISDAYKKCSFVYVSAAVLDISFDVIGRYADLCCKENKMFVLSTNPSKQSAKIRKELRHIIGFVCILFGNENEIVELAQELKLSSTTLKETLIQVNTSPKKFNTDRLTVVTRSDKPVITVRGSVVTEHRVPTLSSDKIKDKTAVAEAFIGGFMGKYIQSKSIDECVQMGMGAAQIIIQHIGCPYDAKSEILAISNSF